VQVRGEGSVRVGADINGAIVVVILGNRDPLGSGELLFQVTGDGLLLFPSEGGGTFMRPCLVQGLACGSHGGDERRGCGVILLPLGSGGGSRDGSLLLVNGEVGGAAQHDRQHGGG
jgi:hypothetical protein